MIEPRITPLLDRRVIARDGHRCVLCGAPERAGHAPLGVAHLVELAAGVTAGLTRAELLDPENLIAACAACRAAPAEQRLALPVAVAVLRARISWRNREART